MYVTLIKRAMCFEMFASLLESQSVFLIVYVTFIKQARCFQSFASLLYIERGLLNCLRHFYKASDAWNEERLYLLLNVRYGDQFQLQGS